MRRTPLKPKPRGKYGLCECGCGQKTRIAPSSWAARGWVKGEPVRFISGHNNKRTELGNFSLVISPYHNDPCWILSKVPNSKGYVQVRLHGRYVMAHREVYERHRGPVPAGLQLDHLCRNRACVNPWHLEPVTCKENIVRGWQARAA